VRSTKVSAEVYMHASPQPLAPLPPALRQQASSFTPEDAEQSIASRFEQQAQKYPYHVAITMGDLVLSYAALNSLSNRLAQAILARRGEGPEPVALLLEHGVP
jgi:non-ribosomal peptide synthetase component F